MYTSTHIHMHYQRSHKFTIELSNIIMINASNHKVVDKYFTDFIYSF